MKLIVEIDLDNAAFWDDDDKIDYIEVTRILNKLCNDYNLESVVTDKKLRDINGNTVGFAKITK